MNRLLFRLIPRNINNPNVESNWYTCCTIQHRTNVCFAAIFALCFSAFPAVYAQGFSVFYPVEALRRPEMIVTKLCLIDFIIETYAKVGPSNARFQRAAPQFPGTSRGYFFKSRIRSL